MNLSSLLQFLPLLQGGNFANLFGGDNNIADFFLKGLGINGDDAQTILTAISKLLNGDLDLKTLLPLLLPIAIEYFGKQEQKENAPSSNEAFDTVVKLSPVENIADEKIYISLENYFNNDNAS